MTDSPSGDEVVGGRPGYVALPLLAVGHTLAVFMAVMSSGMTCDAIMVGEPQSFLCRHERLRFLLHLSVSLGIVTALARGAEPGIRRVSGWAPVPFGVMVWLVYEWWSAYPEWGARLSEVTPWFVCWMMSLVSILVVERFTPAAEVPGQ